MIIVGAGGHALEVYDILQAMGKLDQLEVYDEDYNKTLFYQAYKVKHHLTDLISGEFCLGVGSPEFRKNLYHLIYNQNKKHFSLRGSNSTISDSAKLDEVDVFHHCFIGPQSQLEKGCLVNTGAQIHHEVQIGEFSVVNPGAILLGACQIGDFCSIGAHATILPGIKIGNSVTIGAGAVIIRDVADGKTVVGVPGRVISGKSV